MAELPRLTGGVGLREPHREVAEANLARGGGGTGSLPPRAQRERTACTQVVKKTDTATRTQNGARADNSYSSLPPTFSLFGSQRVCVWKTKKNRG